MIISSVKDIISQMIDHPLIPTQESATAFAPANLELAKNWGYRNEALNLPMTSSLSLSLGDIGVTVNVSCASDRLDQYCWNSCAIDLDSKFYNLLSKYLSYFRPAGRIFNVQFASNVNHYAGVDANCAAFAALVKAFNQLFGWQLTNDKLSTLARFGYGAACRSIWPGFVKWRVGHQMDGMDTCAVPIQKIWPDLCVGFVKVDRRHVRMMPVGEAMAASVKTSSDYELWPNKSRQVVQKVEQAIEDRNIALLGYFIENHSIMMHAIIETARPPIVYTCNETVEIRKQVWRMRRDKMAVFFTQDADPHLKLWFLKKDRDAVLAKLPEIKIILPMQAKQQTGAMA